ncbi:MAG TPA: siroheme synthase CysG [Beijerinckiaceae bacterium]|nr:siroheme synthase CysG [Beijerinckiaceae bacterium]
MDDRDKNRKPRLATTPRLTPLATLPVFFKLGGRHVVLAGGSESAAWKAELLAAAGARVEVFAAEPSERMLELAREDQRVVLHPRSFTDSGFIDPSLGLAALAVADATGDEEAKAFAAAAHAAGVPVNVIDKPQASDFQFGSIVNRSPLVVAISTDGGAPVFGQALRARIETLLPQGFALWAAAAKAWRPAVRALGLGFRGRRKFWEGFTRLALERAESVPSDSDLHALMSAAGAENGAPTARGSVVLVGAGPGDPELLTLKAARALQSADVVLYDDLVAPGTLDLARREARKVHVGKRGYKPSCTQEDITRMMVSLAGEGRRVVRLKGGDPMIFGRAGEEIAALRAAGVDVEVVPGVTAASGAAASLALSLTLRDTARRVQFITAHAHGGKLPDDFDWKALADPAATTAVYMGLATLPALTRRLLAEGLGPDTPAVLVERVSWPDERSIHATLATIEDQALAADLVGPCLVLIGRALGDVQAPVVGARDAQAS